MYFLQRKTLLNGTCKSRAYITAKLDHVPNKPRELSAKILKPKDKKQHWDEKHFKLEIRNAP